MHRYVRTRNINIRWETGMDNQALAVSVTRCEEYDSKKVKAALLGALSSIGGLDWVQPGMKIAVKANLMMRIKPERAATVHPTVAVALCELLTERGARVVLGDSPGGPFNAAYIASVYSATGMQEILKAGALLNDDFSYIDVSCPDAVSAKEFQVTKYLADADAIVDLCKIKTHGLMAYTGACKNFFGAVPGTRKSEYHYKYQTHEKFANMLVDICEWCKPRLCVADAVIAMEGNGPSGGTPRQMGALLCSFNPHALDLAASHLMNMGVDDIPTLRAAYERGLIPKTAEELPVFPELAPFVIPDFKLTPKHDVQLWGTTNPVASRILRRMFASRPAVHTGCIGCGECKNACPANAITIVRKRAKIKRDMCVRCFCCQEFCPRGAISVQRPYVAKVMDSLAQHGKSR